MPTCAVLVGGVLSSGEPLAEACNSMGIVPVTAHTTDEAAEAVRQFDAPLVIVLSDHLQTSPLALLEALKPIAPRLVMFGPRFGGAEHVLALELGFDEVWPVDATPVVLSALLRTSLRSPRTAAAKPFTKAVALGDLVVDLIGLTCLDGERPVMLGASILQTLAMLMERAPDVISREELRANIPSNSTERTAMSRAVDVHVSRIRRQLRQGGVTSVNILHVRSRGYRAVRVGE